MTPPRTLIDDAPLRLFHLRIGVLAAGGPFCDGYILGIIGIALALLTPQLHLGSVWVGLLGASALIGLFVGGLVGGYLTDILGRRAMYTLDLVAFVVLSVAQFFVAAAWQLFLVRLLIGIAIGADYPIATSYIAEFSPRRSRGPMLSGLVAFWWIGYVASFVIGYLLVGQGGDIWRWMLASSAVPSVIVLLLRLGVPESPRWLASVGRHDEAQVIIDRYIGEGFALSEPELDTRTGSKLAQIFSGNYGKRTIFVSLFWFLQVAPSFAIHTLQPQLLTSLHVKNPFLATLVITSLSLVGIIPTALYLVNALGRRRLLIGTFVLMALPLGIIGIAPASPAWLIVLGFTVFTISESAGSALQYVYPNEIFPTQIRATAMGFATAISRIGAAVSTFLLPVGYSTIGAGPSMLILCALIILGLLVAVVWAPETKGLTLAEASAPSIRPVA
jgi:MFS transporter, putative metabolite transport protein